MRFSERLPKKYTCIPSKSAYPDNGKHVWSHWNAVCRGLFISSRHQYYTSSNRTRKVTPFCLLTCPMDVIRLNGNPIQLELFDLGAIPSGSLGIAASAKQSRRSRGKGSFTFTQISLDFD